MTDRSDFEAWALSNGFNIEKTDLGIYRVKSTDAMYGGWLAGVSSDRLRASKLEKLAALCPY